MQDNNLKIVAKIRKFFRKIQDDPEQCRKAFLSEINSWPKVQVVGITGPSFVGKSSLINSLIRYLREDGKKVAVLAIDPSSPRSGGSILGGDRLRMREHDLDSGVFIFSIAARQSAGSLPDGLDLMIRLAGTFGDVVIVETAGSGQCDTGIAGLVDTLVVVFEPSGDETSGIKSGTWELAHIVVVNKYDINPAKADRFYGTMKENILSGSVFPKILKTKTTRPEDGIKELVEAIIEHWEHLTKAAHQ